MFMKALMNPFMDSSELPYGTAVYFSITIRTGRYARHERPLLATGAMLIPVFLFFYYYQLDLSLLQKSAALAGSGALLLAGRFYLRRRGWDKAGRPCA